ncbi:hypothetical protein D5086_012713 [Populus alba]|uniref:PRC-barrel domain-containing protein n=3 Tax=Populus TaxID=3689 RepID=A0A4U5QUQ4_POPAL|nr:uncharacterized protein LOC118048117 isoform X1 [Populus alba]KAJ6993139.1 hypothetical protein NC653_016310 [Populus alba x Populus x berolinensis]TKS13297.1 hypothetical protein D5086_0000056100 [Populus alba]
MCDCLPSSPLPFSIVKLQKLRQQSYSTVNFSSVNRSGRLKLTSIKASKNTGEVGFKEKGQEEEEKNFELESSTIQKDKETKVGSLGFDILELKDGERDGKEEQDLVAVEKERNKIRNGRRGKQVIRRSSILAKQVFSIQSALSLGFVSQIWVDTKSWVVLVVEVRPNLLSGESERFLLEDVSQVGDVVLVEDENVMDTELKMIGLETLVGYRVVTPGQRDIGKVRGYSFNINSGAVELLELDSFGISIIPSSLVSTYALPVEDVLEVLSDTVVVHESAASHIQRLTKGFWDAQNVGTKIDEGEEYSDYESPVTSHQGRSTRRNSRSQKFRSKIRESEDDWELPMDYL